MGDIFYHLSFRLFCSCFMNGGLPKFWGKKVTWPISTGEQGNEGKMSKGTREKKVLGNVNTGTKHSFVTGRTKKGEKRRNRHLSCDVFFSFFQSVFMELRQRLNWGMSICYESTLGNWMLSKINNKIGGKQEHSEITVTTYYLFLISPPC